MQINKTMKATIKSPTTGRTIYLTQVISEFEGKTFLKWVYLDTTTGEEFTTKEVDEENLKIYKSL